MMLKAVIFFVVGITACISFTPTTPIRQHHLGSKNCIVPALYRQQPILLIQSSSTSLSSSSTTTNSNNDFDSYSIDNKQQKLAYNDVIVGTGDSIQSGKVVTVAYEGRLLDNNTNKKFDSGKGFSFRVGEGRVIPGWEQGLVGMKVGGKRILRIPPYLAYGERGAKDVIPPNAHLEFECELMSIANNSIEETISLINIQPERIITFVLLLLLVIVSPNLPKYL